MSTSKQIIFPVCNSGIRIGTVAWKFTKGTIGKCFGLLSVVLFRKMEKGG